LQTKKKKREFKDKKNRHIKIIKTNIKMQRGEHKFVNTKKRENAKVKKDT
jgi:hypothetical protein